MDGTTERLGSTGVDAESPTRCFLPGPQKRGTGCTLTLRLIDKIPGEIGATSQPLIHYRVARKNRVKESRLVFLFISINPKHINRSELLALACALGKRFQRAGGLSVYMFDSDHAAESYNPQGEGNSDAMIRSLCGLYRMVREGQVIGQEMLVRSDPNSLRLDTRIDLGPPP